MDMRIGGASPVSGVRADAASHWKKGLQGFAALKTALQAGDLDGAKVAFSSLHVPQSQHAKSPLAKLGQVLESGDVVAAQTMMQDLLAARMSHAVKAAPVNPAPVPPASTSGGISLLA
jgi:hypothetical protein